MTLQEKIQTNLEMAVAVRDNPKRDFLKVIIGELSRLNDKVIANSEVLKLLRRMKENAILLKNDYELIILDGYLPQMMGEAEITVMITNIIESNSFTSIKDMGKVMGIIAKSPVSNIIDNKIASNVVRKLLA
jgi:uncharacterized protein